MNQRFTLSARRKHITQKVRVSGHRTVYFSVHHDPQPAEVFHRLKRSDCSSELIGLYDVIARPMSLALQYGALLEKVGDLLAGAKFEPRSTTYDAGHGRFHRALEGCRGHDRSLVLVEAGATGQPESLDSETGGIVGA